MSELEQFSRLIGAIYEATLDDTRWHDLARQFAGLFGVHSCALQVRDTNGGMILLGVTDNVTSDRLMLEYLQHYYKVDLWALAAMNLPDRGLSNTAVIEAQLGLSKQILQRNEIYEFHKKTDMWHLLGASLELGNGANGIIGIHGGWSAAPFDEAARDKLNLLLPHLRRAFQMRATLRENAIQHDMATSALDALECAVVLVDENAKLHYVNAAGDTLLRSGLTLSVQGGRVHAVAPKHAHALAFQIRQACLLPASEIQSARPCGTVALPRAGQSPLLVTVARVRAGDMSAIHDMPLAMLIIPLTGDSGERRVPHPDVLRAVFGLSQAEAGLACQLTQGRSIKEIALRRGVSLNTARTQLKMALHKTGAKRQSELVALVLGLK